MSDELEYATSDEVASTAEVLAMPEADQVWVAAGAPVLLVGLAWVLPWLLDFVLGLPFFPWRRRFQLVDSLTDNVSAWVLSLIAVVVGPVIAAVLIP